MYSFLRKQYNFLVTILMWFRQDLRLHDNLALQDLSYQDDFKSSNVVPVYIKDPATRIGAASCLWLEQSLKSLNKSLDDNLRVYDGDSTKILEDLIQQNDISHVVWNKCYNSIQDQIDNKIKKYLIEKQVNSEAYNSSLLWDPADTNLLNQQDMPYQVFTHFYKNAVKYPPRQPVLSGQRIKWQKSETTNNLCCGLKDESWHKKFHEEWDIGEEAALRKLNSFLEKGINGYKDGRNNLNYQNVSMLSPHIHFGEISVNHIWYQTIKSNAPQRDKDHFHSELGWREFAHYMTHHFDMNHG